MELSQVESVKVSQVVFVGVQVEFVGVSQVAFVGVQVESVGVSRMVFVGVQVESVGVPLVAWVVPASPLRLPQGQLLLARLPCLRY